MSNAESFARKWKVKVEEIEITLGTRVPLQSRRCGMQSRWIRPASVPRFTRITPHHMALTVVSP